MDEIDLILSYIFLWVDIRFTFFKSSDFQTFAQIHAILICMNVLGFEFIDYLYL